MTSLIETVGKYPTRALLKSPSSNGNNVNGKETRAKNEQFLAKYHAFSDHAAAESEHIFAKSEAELSAKSPIPLRSMIAIMESFRTRRTALPDMPYKAEGYYLDNVASERDVKELEAWYNCRRQIKYWGWGGVAAGLATMAATGSLTNPVALTIALTFSTGSALLMSIKREVRKVREEFDVPTGKPTAFNRMYDWWEAQWLKGEAEAWHESFEKCRVRPASKNTMAGEAKRDVMRAAIADAALKGLYASNSQYLSLKASMEKRLFDQRCEELGYDPSRLSEREKTRLDYTADVVLKPDEVVPRLRYIPKINDFASPNPPTKNSPDYEEFTLFGTYRLHHRLLEPFRY